MEILKIITDSKYNLEMIGIKIGEKVLRILGMFYYDSIWGC